MSKLEIDFNSLKNDFTNKINDSINNLSNIIDMIEKLDKPSSFSYSTYLKKLPTELQDIKEECIDIKNYIIKSCDNYSKTSEEITKLFNIKKDF